jgi:hypothetical protein
MEFKELYQTITEKNDEHIVIQDYIISKTLLGEG